MATVKQVNAALRTMADEMRRELARAEVERLRGLVKSAYYEGAHGREGQTAGDSRVEFDDSSAAEKLRAALA